MNEHRYYCTCISIDPGHLQCAILPHVYVRVSSSNKLILGWMNPNNYTAFGTYSIISDILKSNVKFK